MALATVLKQLEDEVKHMKLKFAAYERVYVSHDPAIGQRKRKALKEKIDLLLREIEKRSEQIYALYDVLEGQKDAATQMNPEQVDETLQSLDINPASLAERVAKKQNKKTSAAGRAPSSMDKLDELLADNDNDLPWEGSSEGSETEARQTDKRRRVSLQV